MIHHLINHVIYTSVSERERERRLCLEASHAAGSGGTSSRSRSSSVGAGDHLDRDAAAEGPGVAGVDELDQAGVGLAGDVARAGGAGGYVDLEGVVLVDVGRTLHDADGLEGAGPEALLGLLDVALVAGHLGDDLHLGPGLAGAVGVDHGLVRAGAVGGDDVESAGDGAAGGDLGQGGAGLDHGLLGAGLDVVVALAVGASAGILLVTLEDGGVGLGDLVLARARDDGTLDAESSAVATSIASGDGDLAVGGNERGGCESDEEDLGEHLGCG